MGSVSSKFQELLAARIGQGILDMGYSGQDNFARSIGVPRATVHRLLKANLDPRLSTLEKVAEGLDIPLATLLNTSKTETSLQQQPERSNKSPKSLHTKGRRPNQEISAVLTISGANEEILEKIRKQGKIVIKSDSSGKLLASID